MARSKKRSPRQTPSRRKRTRDVTSRSPHKMTVVLDIDETLIHSFEPEKYPYHDKKCPFMMHKMGKEFFVCERPGLQPFLDWLFRTFHVVVWSAGSPEYVKYIVKEVVKKTGRKPIAVLTSDDCDISDKKYKERKALQRIWDDLELACGPQSTILIDDLEENRCHQPGNCIKIRPFVGKKDDNELEKVKRKLLAIHAAYQKPIGLKFRPLSG